MSCNIDRVALTAPNACKMSFLLQFDQSTK